MEFRNRCSLCLLSPITLSFVYPQSLVDFNKANFAELHFFQVDEAQNTEINHHMNKLLEKLIKIGFDRHENYRNH